MLSLFSLNVFAQSTTTLTATTPTTTATTPTAPSITVKTDKNSYTMGDTIVISGQVQAVVPDTPLTIEVLNPNTNIIYVNQINISSDGKYTTTIMASCSPGQQCLWNSNGMYTVKVQYGLPNVTTQAQFTFQSSNTPVSSVFQVKDPNSLQTFSVTYTITGGNIKDMTIDAQSISLDVSVNSTSDGTITLQMPRTLIDAKTNTGLDESFIILIDGAEVKSQSESSSSDSRTLTIPFLQGDQNIEIIGTQIVPEFGPIAALVLAIAIVSIIAVSAKTGLRLVPKY
jgi:predicted secreted protein with PEFG-CTERM motif